MLFALLNDVKERIKVIEGYPWYQADQEQFNASSKSLQAKLFRANLEGELTALKMIETRLMAISKR